jgi:hypothetical protein
MKDALWYLTRDVLEHADRYKWKRNANLLVTDFTNYGVTVGLSIFDSRYTAPDGLLVHSHRSDFTSRIVAGVMHQQRYTEVKESEPNAIRCTKLDFDVNYLPVTKGPVEAWFLEDPEERYSAGAEYTMMAPELHRTWPESGTVTFRITQYINARRGVTVVWRPGETPQKAPEGQESTIKRHDEVTPMVLADVVANSLSRWF